MKKIKSQFVSSSVPAVTSCPPLRSKLALPRKGAVAVGPARSVCGAGWARDDVLNKPCDCRHVSPCAREADSTPSHEPHVSDGAFNSSPRPLPALGSPPTCVVLLRGARSRGAARSSPHEPRLFVEPTVYTDRKWSNSFPPTPGHRKCKHGVSTAAIKTRTLR